MKATTMTSCQLIVSAAAVVVVVAFENYAFSFCIPVDAAINYVVYL